MASASASAAALEKARQLLEEAAAESLPAEQVDALPSGFYDAFVLCGIRVHAVEPGRLLCHFTVPARLLVSPPPSFLPTSGSQIYLPTSPFPAQLLLDA
ncbi:hypothetical protein ZWY2020_005544 [Hordeum vulgare]|nr:hypothetical protein ZWY2020_005544 [Hordeum vulgare]